MGRLFLVSDRLPFTTVERGGEQWLYPSDGGLATALRRVHSASNGLWFGSVSTSDQRVFINNALRDGLSSIRLRLVCLAEKETPGFYRRYSDEVLWPVLHGRSPFGNPESWWWDDYGAVTAKFADAIASEWRPGDVIWIHDYPLMLLPRMLRDRIPSARIGFFLHTPLPTPFELERLREWPQLAAGISGANIAGFQTMEDAQNFTAAIGGRWRLTGANGVSFDRGDIRVAHCPIAVDHAWFAERSRHPAVRNQRAAFRAEGDGPLFVGIDRLDMTKGILERLEAFDRLLRFEPHLRGHARFVQIGIPVRERVRGYAEFQSQVAQLAGRINAEFATPNWTPVDYRVGEIDSTSLVALYSAADVMVVTPIRDGMNLVAKEFVASRTDGGGALVLSRTAGAVQELRASVKVDASNAVSIMNGYRRALSLSSGEKRLRMQKLRNAVLSRDTLRWATDFLAWLGGGDLLENPRDGHRGSDSSGRSAARAALPDCARPNNGGAQLRYI